MIKRREEHDSSINNSFCVILSFKGYVNRGDEGEVAEGEHQESHEDFSSCQDVGVVRTVETSVSTAAVTSREGESSTVEVGVAFSVGGTFTLDTWRRSYARFDSSRGGVHATARAG